jgi:NADH:ubiquinone oxidoreductase subunit 3 (subunit A)
MNPANAQNNGGKDEYKDSESIVLDLETLSMQYRNLLIEYENSVNNYISFLQEEAISPQSTMVNIENAAFWGTTSVGASQTSNVQQCEALCSKTANCSGATYDTAQRLCMLRGGDSAILAASANEVAIVKKGKKLLENIQSINKRLTNINKQIQSITHKGQHIYTDQSQQRGTKTTELISQFISLTEEREKIDNMISVYQTLDQKQAQGNLTITQNYYSFVLLLFLVVIIIIVLFYLGGSSAESQGISSILTTNFIVIIAFLFALLIASIVIVINKSAVQVTNILPTSWIPTRLPDLKLSKFGWN